MENIPVHDKAYAKNFDNEFAYLWFYVLFRAIILSYSYFHKHDNFLYHSTPLSEWKVSYYSRYVSHDSIRFQLLPIRIGGCLVFVPESWLNIFIGDESCLNRDFQTNRAILHRRLASRLLSLRRLVGERNRWTRRAGSQDREDGRVSASLFSQPWQSGVKVVSDLGLLWRR